MTTSNVKQLYVNFKREINFHRFLITAVTDFIPTTFYCIPKTAIPHKGS